MSSLPFELALGAGVLKLAFALNGWQRSGLLHLPVHCSTKTKPSVWVTSPRRTEYRFRVYDTTSARSLFTYCTLHSASGIVSPSTVSVSLVKPTSTAICHRCRPCLGSPCLPSPLFTSVIVSTVLIMWH